MTGEQTPSLRVARSCVFSPVSPLFRGRTGRQRRRTGRQQNSLRLFCFLPVNLVFVVAALLSRCRCGGACPPTRRDLLSGRRDNILAAHTLARMFSLRATLSFLRYVFAERKRIYYKKVRGTTLEKVNLL